MREDRNSRDRVSRRSSTGIKRDVPERERRQRIRMFEDTDDLYGDNGGWEQKDEPRYDRYEERREDRYRDDRRREDDYDRRERDEDRYGAERRREERYRDAYERDDDRDDRRREDNYDRRDDRRREESYHRRDDRRSAGHRTAPRKQSGGRKRSAAGGDTERFAHQIIPYVTFWVALFGAVSLILRDVIGADGSTGAFGSWFADFLCGLLGPIAYFLPVFLVVIALRWKKFVREGILAKKILLSTAFLVLLSAIVHVFMESKITRGVIDVNGAILYTAGMNMAGGGFFGGFVGEYIGYVLRAVGTGLLCIPLLLVIGIYLVGLTPGELWQRISVKLKQMSDRRRERDRARYSGEEERRLHNSRRNKEGVVKYEDKQKARSDKKKPIDDEPTQYEFREEEDEVIVPARRGAETEKAEQERAQTSDETIDVVDIPDDEPEDVSATKTETVLRRAGTMSDTEQTLQDILDQISRESEAKKSEASAAPNEEERPLQGTYYSPFSLTHRSKPKEEPVRDPVANVVTDLKAPPAADQPVVDKAEEALGATAPRDATTYYENGVLTERHAGTTIYKRDPVQRPVAEAFSRPVAEETVSAPTFDTVEKPAPVTFDQADEITSGMAFADDTPAQPAVSERETVAFERMRLADDFIPPVEEEKNAATVTFTPVLPSFEDEDEEIVSAPAPAKGVRTTFALPDEEPVQKPEAAPVRPARGAQSVPTRTEAVKSTPAPAPEPPPTPREHKYPPITLLNEDKSVKGVDHTEEIEEKKELLRQTLADFNVRIRDQVECSRGPAITRYELRPEAGVSVRQVINRQDDIALALAAEVRIEAPIPGKPAIGIEVPNAVRETVYMRTMLESEEFQKSTKPLEVPLGMGIGGNIQMCNLAAMPHVLVAGTTGSGKSVCINTILISLMYKTSPRDLRLILIDPKQVEFAAYAHVPHLYAPIVTENARAVGALACAVQEMERRYSLIKDVGVRDIDAYNEAVKNDPDREHLPRMVIVIDEFADLKMGCTTNDPENFTCRIAQKARAAGMHLIIGTQRPSVDVITGKLKNNIPSRIAFTVKQQVDSRTILDSNGAESLTGKGDMLYMPIGAQKPARVQGAFVSDGEVERVISYIRDHNDPVQYNQAFMDQIEVEMARAANTGRKGDDFDDIDDEDDGGEDPKFREAVELAIETQKVATSLLQRRLGVGYGRAAKIIDRMEALGYVSAPEGNKARKVLITAQEYAARLMEGGDGEFEDEYDA